MTIFCIRKIAFLSITTLLLAGCNDDKNEYAPDTGTPDKNWTLPSSGFPLGTKELKEDIQKIILDDGIELYQITRGYSSLDDGFEVEVGYVTSEQQALELEQQLSNLGYRSKRVVPPSDQVLGQNPSTWIRLDARYFSAAQADAVVKELKGQKFANAKTRFSAEDGLKTTGPWHINVLVIHPHFKGNVKSVLANDVIEGKETTSSIAQRTNAIAAINAGFFVVKDTSGTPGDLAGLSVIGGQIVSEGVEGRPGFFIENKGTRRSASLETNITTQLILTNDQNISKRIDGLNRAPGLNFNCGNPFDLETEQALHDVTCTDPNEIIVFSQIFGKNTPKGDGVEIVIDQNHIVTEVHPTRGMPVPATGQTIQGIGKGKDWLLENAKIGQKIELSSKLINQDTKQPILLQNSTYAVNGGPTLLLNGQSPQINQIICEGFGYKNLSGVPETYATSDRQLFTNDWFLRRNPHTLMGVTQDNTLLFVTVDGRAPRYSAGMSVPESALVMKYLGAKNALKLDGGGSTMMNILGKPKNVPSDATGERPDGDAIVISK